MLDELEEWEDLGASLLLMREKSNFKDLYLKMELIFRRVEVLLQGEPRKRRDNGSDSTNLVQDLRSSEDPIG